MMPRKSNVHTCTQKMAHFLHEESCALSGPDSEEIYPKVSENVFGLNNPPLHSLKGLWELLKKNKLHVILCTVLSTQVEGYK